MPYNAASQSEHLAPPRVLLLFDSIASAQRERSTCVTTRISIGAPVESV